MASVLIVDDHQGTLDTFSTVLSRSGYEVTTAATGRTAIEAARVHRFDVHLIDLMLPDMSGIDVVRALRANGATTPMVIVTAFPSLDSSFDAATVGAAGYVEGMLLPDELLEVVSHALAGRLPVRHPGGDTAVTAMPAHPDDPVRTDPRVREMIRAIDARLSRSLSPGEIAGVLHMSESRVRHLFKVSVGVPLMTFAKERRLQTSALRLATTTDYVSQIAAALGFGSAREFAKSFRKRFGMPPKVYRARFWRGFRHRE